MTKPPHRRSGATFPAPHGRVRLRNTGSVPGSASPGRHTAESAQRLRAHSEPGFCNETGSTVRESDARPSNSRTALNAPPVGSLSWAEQRPSWLNAARMTTPDDACPLPEHVYFSRTGPANSMESALHRSKIATGLLCRCDLPESRGPPGRHSCLPPRVSGQTLRATLPAVHGPQRKMLLGR